MLLARLACCLLAASFSLCAGAGSAAAQDCPGSGLLLFERAVYSEEPAPPGGVAERGAALGSGRLAFVEAAGCDPQDVEVVALTRATPDLAVAVDGRPDSIFVLGARCAGYEDEERSTCILEPLTHDGRMYTGARYPDGVSPTRLVWGDPLGDAELGDESMTAVAIEGVDPAVAVGVSGRPDEAFVAAGACPYERFAEDEANDDLLRCLRAPLWLIFELEQPPAARAGETITARADRSVADVVDGATLSLVLLEGSSDVVPSSLSGAIEIGSVTVDPEGRVSVPITVPDVPTGVYEAIVSCEACADQFGGETVFAAGSVAIVGDDGGGGPRTVGIVIGSLLFVALALAVVAWRRGWWRLWGKRSQEEPPPPQ